MKQLLAVVLIPLIIVIAGCTTAVKYKPKKTNAGNLSPKESSAPIDVYYENDSIDIPYSVVGEISVGDTGFTIIGGNLNSVIEDAKSKARNIGADAIQITSISEPDMWSTIYSIKAHAIVYKNDYIPRKNLPEQFNNKQSIELEKALYKYSFTNEVTYGGHVLGEELLESGSAYEPDEYPETGGWLYWFGDPSKFFDLMSVITDNEGEIVMITCLKEESSPYFANQLKNAIEEKYYPAEMYKIAPDETNEVSWVILGYTTAAELITTLDLGDLAELNYTQHCIIHPTVHRIELGYVENVPENSELSGTVVALMYQSHGYEKAVQRRMQGL